MSVFAWLDSSERDRRRTLDVIDLFQQKETVDELGLGSVRDVVADVLAPGTSTIQTRARYFFFVTWLYTALERRFDLSDIETRARKAEAALIPELLDATDSAGAIGRLAGGSVKRLPSSVYWAGLGRLGFRLFGGSRDQYHRSLRRGRRPNHGDDAGDLSVEALKGNWHPQVPEPPDGFPAGASFALTRSEAEFFCSQCDTRAEGSLLHFLVRRGELVPQLAAPWQHPAVTEMPPRLRQWISDAKSYSELMHGAQILYNLMLAESRGVEAWVSDYRSLFDEWMDGAANRNERYRDWSRESFWTRVRRENPNLPAGAERFSESWIGLVLGAPTARRLADSPQARSLITERERYLKGGRARLQSRTHLELWGGASGTAALDYRWFITRTIANDVIAGLQG